MKAALTKTDKVRQSILDCTACPLSSPKKVTPVPFSGPVPNDILVVGEAPGETENNEGAPFVGDSGQLLRTLMRKAELVPEQLAWTNSVQCWPRPQEGRNPPPEYALSACRGNLRQVLDLVDPKYVLLVGAVALRRIRKDLKISRSRGKMIVGKQRCWYAVWHPSYVLRNGGEHSEAGIELLEDLKRFRMLMEKGRL